MEALVRQSGDEPLALARLALQFHLAQAESRSLALVEQALQLAPDDPEIRAIGSDLLSRNVPEWHFSIVADGVRNAAYEAALRRAARADKRILDIGAGTGLLALMAARAGAGEVISCEMNPTIAAAAANIVAENGFTDRVRIVAKHSDDLKLEDLGGTADIVVSEIVSNDLLGERALPALEKIGRCLVSPEARFIPARTTIRIALADDARLHKRWLAEVEGFDFSAFNGLAKPLYPVRTDAGRISLRSAAADLFDFEFGPGRSYRAGRTRVELEATGGKANGIVQWIRLELDSETWYENAPDCGFRSCWAMLFHPLAEPIELAPGETMAVGASHDCVSLRIWPEAQSLHT